jgi:hypothetical protein
MGSEAPEPEEKDLSYDEAQQKKLSEEGEAIKSMNNALKLTGRVAQLVGHYYVGLIALGVPEEVALELTKVYSEPLIERFM